MTMSDRICLMNAGRIEQLGTPADLYFRPRSVFVADFLGESNLLSGTVEAGGDGEVQVRLAGGGTPARAAVHAPLVAGTRVRVMVRPQNLGIAPRGGAVANAVEGRVLDRMITGSLTKLYVQSAATGDEPMVLCYPTSSRDAPHAIGDEVTLHWNGADAVAVPEAA